VNRRNIDLDANKNNKLINEGWMDPNEKHQRYALKGRVVY